MINNILITVLCIAGVFLGKFSIDTAMLCIIIYNSADMIARAIRGGKL